MKVEMKSTVEIDVDMLAKIFCALDDDEMARFFVKVNEEASKVPTFGNQWYYLRIPERCCGTSFDTWKRASIVD